MQLAMLELLLVLQLFGSAAAVEGELLVVAELVAEHAVAVPVVAAAEHVAAAAHVAAAELGDAFAEDDVGQAPVDAKLYFAQFLHHPLHSRSNLDQQSLPHL